MAGLSGPPSGAFDGFENRSVCKPIGETCQDAAEGRILIRDLPYDARDPFPVQADHSLFQFLELFRGQRREVLGAHRDVRISGVRLRDGLI